MPDFEAEHNAILNEVDDLDEFVIGQTVKQLTNLRKRLIQTISGLAGATLLQHYYHNILDAVNNEIKIFQSYFMEMVGNNFEKQWEYGVQIAQMLAEARGVSIAIPTQVAKDAIKTYINSEASTLVDSLNARLRLTLQRAFLGEQNLQQILKEIADLIEGKRTLKMLVSRPTSALIGAFNKSAYLNTKYLIDSYPEQFKNVTKTWVWSHVQRMNHAVIDGTTIPFNHRFRVPGWGSTPAADMEGPHDDSAPIGQVIHCKCLLKIGGLDGEN